MYDSHTHTINSPDAWQTADQLCLAAIEKGIKGVAVTEHTHVSPVYQHYFPGFDPEKAIRNSIRDVLAAKEKYGDRLHIGCGLEVDEYLDDPTANDRLMACHDYDVILGSIHYLKNGEWDLQYSKVVYDGTVSDQRILDYLKKYFEAVALMAEKTDMDVLAHLTCPMRYINGRHKRTVDISCFSPIIKDILKTLVRRNIALEVNTTGLLLEEFGYALCPDEEILRTYRELGGKLLTLGSDAHRSFRIAEGFAEAKNILKDLGFTQYHYYEKRRPCPINIE